MTLKLDRESVHRILYLSQIMGAMIPNMANTMNPILSWICPRFLKPIWLRIWEDMFWMGKYDVKSTTETKLKYQNFSLVRSR